MQHTPHYEIGFTEEELLEMELNTIRRKVLPPNAPSDITPATYISGKITGEPNGNRERFQAAEDLLLAKGFMTYNPHKLPANHDKSWSSYMKVCVEYVPQMDIVFALQGWKRSRGAVREVLIAEWLGIPVYSLESLSLVKVGLWTKIKLALNLI